MKKIVLMGLLIGGIQFVTAQTIVRGKIVDNDKAPVAAANVLLLAETDSSLIKAQAAGLAGEFELVNVGAGNYILSVEMVGYHTFYRRLQILSDQRFSEQDIVVLTPVATNMKEVVVAGRKRLFETQIDRTIFNVQSTPAAAGLSTLEILARSPNIDIDRLNNQILMNGKQGVVVLLNGKPMRMDQSALMQYLSSLPAANIKRIEFIHTPPASMEASGNAGVINIETIKKEDEGINGSWSLNAGHGERGKYGGSFNLNFNKGKINFFTDFSFNNNYTRQDLINNIISNIGNVKTTSNIFSKRPAFTSLVNGRMGLEYQITKKSSIGMLLSGYISQWKLDARTETAMQNDIGYYSLSKLSAAETNNWKHLMGNINFQHVFSKNAKLTADADYLYYIDNNPAYYKDAVYNRDGSSTSSSSFNSRKKTPINFVVANIDYTKTISDKMKIQLGVKSTASSFTNDVGVDRFINNAWKPDSIFTDILKLNETIQAAYLSTDYQFTEKYFLRLGVRYEKTKSDLTGSGNKSLLQLNYGRLFPVVSFSYRFTENRQLQLSYNERITRPQFSAIAPAFFFFSPNSIVGGNPGVRPTISRQFTTGYQLKNFLFTLQLTSTEKPIVWQPFADTLRNFVMLKAENMKTARTAMFSINYNAKIKWWSSQYNFSLFGQQLQPVVNGAVLKRTDFYFTFNTTQSFKLPANFNVELSNQTSAARNYGLGKNPFVTAFNLGLQKNIKTKNKLALSWTDIFNTGSFLDIRYNQPQLNVQYDFIYQYEGSVLKLTFVHQFGNTKVKKAAGRKESSADELKRVN